ncbi:MAG: GNAT family N-acetyltransferase [Vulcanimicrobiaceae bacterium]
MPVEIVRVQPDEVAAFLRETEREALKSLYDFSVIWHEQSYGIAAKDGDRTVGAIKLGVAASLCQIESLVVLPGERRRGIGRTLLAKAADLANYYNCHKMTVLVPHKSGAQQFFERCNYREEAVLPQHTFKLDMAVLRQFLL